MVLYLPQEQWQVLQEGTLLYHFEERSSAIDNPVDTGALIGGLLFGNVGTNDFNIDRFIVTSTGKGDGTEAITWMNLRNS